MSWLGDPKLLSVGILIDNLIAYRTSHISGMSHEDQKQAAKSIILELGRRFPNDQLLDAVKGDKSSPTVTQNFDVSEKDPHDLDSGWYIAKFIVTEVVEIRHDGEGACVYRIGENRRRSLAEFKFIQKVMFHPNAPKETTNPHGQPELVITEDFSEVWMKLNRLLVHHDNNIRLVEDRDIIVFVMNMFQNRATIKDSNL